MGVEERGRGERRGEGEDVVFGDLKWEMGGLSSVFNLFDCFGGRGRGEDATL